MTTPPVEPVLETIPGPVPESYYAPMGLPPHVAHPLEKRETPGFADLLIFLAILTVSFIGAIALGGIGVGLWASMHRVTVASLTGTKGQQMALAVPFQLVFYVLVAICSIPVYRLRWHRKLNEGAHWNYALVCNRLGLLVLGGVVLSVIVSVVSSKFIHTPTDAPMYELFRNARLAWTATIFGIFIAPPAEEFAFRGFLFPVLRRYTGSVAAVLLTSLPFAMMHASQIGHAWAAVGVLFSVSAVLCIVRLRFNSVAASTIVHMSYNATLFIAMIAATGGYRHFEKIPH